MKLYHYGDAPLFLTMTGMTHQAFMEVFDVSFVYHNQQHNMAGRGSPLPLYPIAKLYLFFVGSTLVV